MKITRSIVTSLYIICIIRVNVLYKKEPIMLPSHQVQVQPLAYKLLFYKWKDELRDGENPCFCQVEKVECYAISTSHFVIS